MLARDLARRAEARTVDAALIGALRARFDRDLDPHLRVEEDVLLPALRALGEGALAERVGRDHAHLRSCVAAAERGEFEGVAAFAERLAEHMRFEERELFPRCEQVLPGAALDEAGRRSAQKR